MKESILSPCWR